MIQLNILYTIQDNFKKALKESTYNDNFIISSKTKDYIYRKREI